MTRATLSSYDETPYVDLAFAQSHPSRLAAMARLFGIEPPDVATARVLDLGCARGGNMISMAVAMPRATFLGIDLSARQISDGQRVVDALGLTNIELRHADIAEVDRSYGQFDYIVSHGIYSWVPAPIREKLLAICRDNLVPNGVAFVSYNAMPGWGMRGIVRDMMFYHARDATTAPERNSHSREALEFLSRHLPPDTPYAVAMRQILDGLADVDDSYLNHDYLEVNNDAFYFHQFVAAAEKFDLQYLGEAEFSAMAPQIPRELKETLRHVARDLIAREQYLDFLHHRSFRQTLLVHSRTAINRNLDPHTLAGFDIASSVQPTTMPSPLAQGVDVTFRTPAGATASTVSAISKAALVELGTCWPQAIPFAQLVDRARNRLAPTRPADSVARADDARTLGIEMLQCYAAAVLELRTWSPDMAVIAGERPIASPLARLQATRGIEVTNLLHRAVALNPLAQAMLPLLDGAHDRAMLADTLTAKMHLGELALPSAPDMLSSAIDETLAGFGKAALLLR